MENLARGARPVRWIGLLGIGALLVGCASPPHNPDDACAIFSEKRSWYRAAKRSTERWGVPEAVQLAIIHQESSFRSDARPPRTRILWIFPGPRPSSAYGYGQVLDETWARYQRATGNGGADRDDFGDVADFIGWYGQHIHRRTGIAKDDASKLYLAYHEGPGGYLRGTHKSKRWLLSAARQVDSRAMLYRVQVGSCRKRLERRWYWPF
ncbi:MAG: transglycosylase SLT domain-containing protein [Myxococcota bacterium]